MTKRQRGFWRRLWDVVTGESTVRRMRRSEASRRAAVTRRQKRALAQLNRAAKDQAEIETIRVSGFSQSHQNDFEVKRS